MNQKTETCDGGCGCGSVRYRVELEPLIVHCCHCRWCQRQTGTAFALNALIEATRVSLLAGEVETIDTLSPSGKGQIIARCPKCRVAVWSNYHMGGLRERIRFIRVGTLDNPDRLPPDVHIFTSTKQPWVILPPDDYAVDEFYNYENTWTRGSLKRRAAMIEAMKAS
ncbi:GFA family protein [uncultured Maricaulis sp.]|uniref:GFA family protein n=1 Tax=uncultured Maricaulis sp. TaxID=174710 RepID=UPI0030DD3B69|tara:strand:+ start:2653 stop:3153 length:501 start_codon:yes stop_codon:yes gene_type:complete